MDDRNCVLLTLYFVGLKY